MRDYNSFAPFYDIAMGDRKEVASELLKIFNEHHSRAKTLLEFGCGTGSLIKCLAKRYDCTGIDCSAGMVKEAKRKVPKCSFSVGDITSVQGMGTFDIVLCAFDTINHITEFSLWKKVFKNAKQHLNESGIFVFDINTEKKLTRYYEEPPFAERKGGNTSVFEVFKRPRGRFDIVVQVFKKRSGSVFTMREMVVHEATFPVPKIIGELSKHFGSVHILDLDRPAPNSKSEELYFICSKPKHK
jgi:SAM-dependent methyltransferase